MPQMMFLVRAVLLKREGLRKKTWKTAKAFLSSRYCCLLPKAFFSDEIKKRPAHNWYSAIRKLLPETCAGYQSQGRNTCTLKKRLIQWIRPGITWAWWYSGKVFMWKTLWCTWKSREHSVKTSDWYLQYWLMGQTYSTAGRFFAWSPTVGYQGLNQKKLQLFPQYLTSQQWLNRLIPPLTFGIHTTLNMVNVLLDMADTPGRIFKKSICLYWQVFTVSNSS